MLTTDSLAERSKDSNKKIRILISAPCLAHPFGDEAIKHCDVDEELVVSRAAAAAVCGAGRGLYMDSSDDPTKGASTLTPARKAAIEQHKGMLAVAATKPPQDGQPLPQHLESMVAVITRSVIAALEKPRPADRA